MWPSTWALSVETCERPNHHFRTPKITSPSRITPMIMKTVRRELLGGGAGAGAEARGAGRAEVSVSGSIVVAIVVFLNAGSARCPPSGRAQCALLPPRNAHRCPRHARGAVKPER